LRGFVEPLITKSKNDSTHSRRIVFSNLQNKEAVTELFREIAPKVANRPGGYTRIIRTGYRLGDNAEMCMIELVDFNEIYTNEKAKSTTRRSRRGGSGAKAATTTTAATEEVVEVEETVENTEATTEQVEETTEESSNEPEAKADDSEETETEEK
jgi:large subunit ribosomal protein L17